jgi:hypothetical protein
MLVGSMPRNEIASETGLATGSVSNLLSEWMKGLQDPQYEAVRELTVQSRRLRMSLTDYAASFRLFNFLKKLKVDENRIESFILNIQDRCMNTTENEELSKQKIVNILMGLLDVSTSESIPLEDVPRFVTEKIEEKQQVVEDIEALKEQKQTAEIEATKAIERKGLTIEAINEHLSVKQELSKFSLFTKDIPKLLTTLKHLHHLRYDPNKVVAKFSSITSLENEENTLRGKILLLKEEQKKHQNILALCEILVVSLQFDTAQVKLLIDTISEIASINRIPIKEAALKFLV